MYSEFFNNVIVSAQIISSLTREEANAVVDAQSKTTLLMKSCDLGDEEMSRLLILNGADPKALAADGTNCLQRAIAKGDVGIIRALRIHYSDEECFALLSSAISKWNDSEEKAVEIVKILLSENVEHYLESHPSTSTCLHAAAKAGHAKLASLLITHGCAPQLVVFNKVGFSPIQVAESQYSKAVQLPYIERRCELLAAFALQINF